MIFVNGKIYSLDKDNSIYEALAVKNKKIADLGKTDDILRKYPNDENIIDLGGKMLMPGFNDSHILN
jgi:hypothetical protein